MASVTRASEWTSHLNAAIESGQWATAASLLSGAITANPDNAELHYSLGVVEGRRGRPGEAVRNLERAIDLNPTHVAALIALGNNLLADGQSRPATGYFERALAARPNAVDALCGLGKAMTDLGAVDDGLRQFDAALRIDPGNVLIHINLSGCLINAGRCAEAVARLEAAFLQWPMDRRVLKALCGAYQRSDVHGAARFYGSLQATGKATEPLHFGAGLLLWLLKDAPRALTAFDHAAAVAGLEFARTSHLPAEPLAFSATRPSPRYGQLLAQYQTMHAGAASTAGQAFEGIQSFIMMAPHVRRFLAGRSVETLLDYGGGRGAQYKIGPLVCDESIFPDMNSYLGIKSATCFDPGAGDTADEILQHDVVISIDVLEHCDVLDLPWIVDLLFAKARSAVFANVANYPASKTLPNGENAHCTLRPADWWRDMFARSASRYPDVRYRLIVSDDPFQRRCSGFEGGGERA